MCEHSATTCSKKYVIRSVNDINNMRGTNAKPNEFHHDSALRAKS